MLRGKPVLLVGMAALITSVLAGVATAQTTRPASAPATQSSYADDYKTRMEAFRKTQSQALQKSLGATDDEWKLLEPKIEKINRLVRLSAVTGAMQYPEDYPEEFKVPAELNKPALELAKLLTNKDVKSEDIKAALESYRKAKAKFKDDLAKARAELKELLTAKQEAQLVLGGVLE